MNLIENMDMGKNSFMFRFQYETRDRHWEMFHAHQGIEFLYVHQGTGHIIMDQQIHQIQNRTLICFQPYQLHKVNMKVSPASPYIRTAFVFDPSLFDHYLTSFPSLHSFTHYLWKEKQTEQIFRLTDDRTLGMFSEFHQRLSASSTYEHQEEMLIFLIGYLRYLRDIFRPESKKKSAQIRPMRHSEKIMEWIELHYKEEFVLERLSSDLHLSPHHISHLFREDTGSTITEYLTVKRIEEACLLLTTTAKSIQEISKLVGLTSDSYFCQLLKKNLGISPYQYRLKANKIYSQKSELKDE